MKNAIRNFGLCALAIIFAAAYYVDILGYGLAPFLMQQLSLGAAAFLMFFNPPSFDFFKKWTLAKTAGLIACLVFGLAAFIVAGLHVCAADTRHERTPW